MQQEIDFMTVAEVARLLRVDQATVRRWIAGGILPAYRVGRRKLYIDRKDVHEFVAMSRTQTQRRQ